jgi:hypothetical protein
MLNTSKIISLINKGESNASVVARGTGINYRTLKSKIDSDSWTANDIEILADYFKKPITYFFDRDEDNSVSEPEIKYYSCPDCITKQQEIDRLNDQLKDKNELLDFYRGKKETSVADSAQYRQAANHGKTG